MNTKNEIKSATNEELIAMLISMGTSNYSKKNLKLTKWTLKELENRGIINMKKMLDVAKWWLTIEEDE